jgi:hypothetical protein
MAEKCQFAIGLRVTAGWHGNAPSPPAVASLRRGRRGVGRQRIRGVRAGAGVIICLLVYMTGGCNAARAGETKWDLAREGWTLARQAGGVEIYRRPLAGSKFAALLARAEFLAEPEEVFVSLSDYNDFAGFIPGVEVSRVLKRQGQDLSVSQRLGFPAPVADRHYVIRIHNDPGELEPGIFGIEWNLDRSQSAALEPRGAIVPGDFSGRWRLAPGEKAGMTNAVYEIHVDPGGRLPAWLFQRVAEGYVFQVMEAVRRRVEAAP